MVLLSFKFHMKSMFLLNYNYYNNSVLFTSYFYIFLIDVVLQYSSDSSSVCHKLFGTERKKGICTFIYLYRSIFVIWIECRFLDTEVDGSNTGISMYKLYNI